MVIIFHMKEEWEATLSVSQELKAAILTLEESWNRHDEEGSQHSKK